MPSLSRTCFAPGCSSQKKLQGAKETKSPSLFKAPKDPLLLQRWQCAIPRTDKILCSRDVVCSLHFLEDDILHFFETKMPDGTINKIKRERPKLKDGVVPRLFLSFPSHLTKVVKRGRRHRERNEITATVQDSVKNSSNFVDIINFKVEDDKSEMEKVQLSQEPVENVSNFIPIENIKVEDNNLEEEKVQISQEPVENYSNSIEIENIKVEENNLKMEILEEFQQNFTAVD